MRIFLLLFLFFIALDVSSRLCCQSFRGDKSPDYAPQLNGLRQKSKVKQLWEGKKTFLSANFFYNRSLNKYNDSGFLQRTSTYNFPVMYGVKLTGNWVAQTGPFVGLNRSRFQNPSLLKETAPMAATTDFAYGFVMAVGHRLSKDFSFQLRYRKDFSSGQHAWAPFQLGWNVSF